MPETLASKDASKKMTASAASVLREEARFRWPTLQYHQERIWRLREWLKWSHRRVRSIYNAEDGVSLRGEEALRIEELRSSQERRKQTAQEASDAVRRSQENYRALEARLSALEALYASIDPELVGQHVAGARAFARGEVGSAVSRGQGNGPERGAYYDHDDPDSYSD